MNNKLSLSELTDQLAESAKISKKEAGIFLKHLFELVEENLVEDKIVKIKGFGTFKLVWVENRRIANVNTGEIQELPGHYKTTFTPDAALAESVNEPFAHLETMILDDESIADQPVASELILQESKTTKPAEVEVETPNKEQAPEEKEEILSSETEPEMEQKQHLEKVELEDSDEIKPSKSKSKWIYYLLALVVIFSATYFGCRFCKFTEPLKTIAVAPIMVKKDTIATPAKDTATIAAHDTVEATPKAEAAKPQPLEKPASNDDILATEAMKEGSRLTLLSLKYYGHKAFWVYIYQENKYLIQNPNSVPAGTIIDIPNPKKYNIDAKNANSLAKAAALATEIQLNQR